MPPLPKDGLVPRMLLEGADAHEEGSEVGDEKAAVDLEQVQGVMESDRAQGLVDSDDDDDDVMMVVPTPAALIQKRKRSGEASGFGTSQSAPELT